MSIPQDGNFLGLSCQLGGLRMNGIVGNTPVSGTAPNLTFVTIDDPAVTQTLSKTITGKFLEVKVGSNNSNTKTESFYIPLYQ